MEGIGKETMPRANTTFGETAIPEDDGIAEVEAAIREFEEREKRRNIEAKEKTAKVFDTPPLPFDNSIMEQSNVRLM